MLDVKKLPTPSFLEAVTPLRINFLCRYRDVFFLMPIENYNSSNVRMETSKEALKISQEVQEAYKNYGYNLIVVPPMSLEERCNFVQNHLK